MSPVNKAEFPKFDNSSPWSDGIYLLLRPVLLKNDQYMAIYIFPAFQQQSEYQKS
jgi:hypothetical protein